MNNQSTQPPKYEEVSPDDQPPPYRDLPLTLEEMEQVYRQKSDLRMKAEKKRVQAVMEAQYKNNFNPLTTVLGLIAEKTPLSLVSAALIIGGSLFK